MNTTGLRALGAAATSIFGVVAALYPNAPLLSAITTALPALKTALPLLLTSVGSIVAAWSPPPAHGTR